ncbi:peptide deformylase [Plantactinospora sp. GCM10030261]|uniref:peptide deformylase n=1 Tax=Plantactinospora sp. GCM10030261 TaxID=3273420 RepID=UPI003611C3E9
MTMRPIRIIGDPVLRTACDPVTSFDAELRGLVTDLLDTMDGAPGRAAVAAPQIGVAARVFVWDVEGSRGHLVNPTLELSDEPQTDDEGCLSVPGLSFPTRRAMHAVARGVDKHGEPLAVSASGYLARALQHEYDHLDGRLYVDTLSGEVRRRALREIRAGRFASPTAG